MANSLVVRKGTDLAKRNKALFAAQYVRMSTDYQRYSIQNQAAAIAVYAQQKSLTIVRTYMDEGRSGLRIKGRAGLIELIDDVQSGRANFDHILVYDVSRWGRFQDTDESAYYEFICKQNGVRVSYCAEQFDNDGSLLSSIVKNLKRVMAAEFSRELSVKIHAAKLRGASLGFRQGGPLSFGLRRELVDEDRVSKGYLDRGQEKYLKTDRVVLRLGHPDEIQVVRRIFNEFVDHRKSAEKIARGLNRDGLPNHRGRPWTRGMVKYILLNENFIGNTVYNRESSLLRGKATKNAPNLWVRNKGAIPAAIDPNVFHDAQQRMKRRWEHLSDDELLSRLKTLLQKEGRLSQAIMNRTLGVPSVNVYDERFGSMRNAYRLIGYKLAWDTDWIERKSEFSALLQNNAADLICRLEGAGAVAKFEPKKDVLRINKRFVFSLRLARSWRAPDRKLIWTINRRTVLPRGYIVAIRLDEGNNSILDYFLLPTKAMTTSKIRFMDAGLQRFDGCRFGSTAQLTKAIIHRINGDARGPTR